MTTSASRFIIALATLALLPAGAHAQDALGSGDVLDGGLSTDGPRNNRRVSEQAKYRARNLLVTGNVAGGRGFRGTVGYTAPGDFTGTTGGDDLYQQRAYAAYSAPQMVQYGGQSIQRSFGQDLGLLEFYRDDSSPGTGTLTRDYQTHAYRTFDREVRIDQQTLQQSLASQYETLVEPASIGVSQDGEGNQYRVVASSARGINVMAAGDTFEMSGLSELDRMRLTEDERAGRIALEGESTIGLPYQTNFVEALTQDSRVEPDQTVPAAIETEEYRNILARVAERYATTAGVTLDAEPGFAESLQQQYAAMREQLAANQQAEADAQAETESQETEEDDSMDESVRPEEEEDRPFNIDDFASVLDHDGRVTQLSGEGEAWFNDLLRQGETQLRDGEFFWAERQFRRAMRIQPGHPLAAAGLAHSQLGAGLYLSASLTLRRVLTDQPEMIDVTYDEGLLPNRVRMLDAVDATRAGLESARDGASSGFLLAYIGQQLGEQAYIEEGLTAMKRWTPDDPLLPLLERLWLDEEAQEQE